MGGVKCITPGHHGPDNSDVLVCKGNRCNVLISSPNQVDEPGILFLLGFGKADHRAGTVNQEGSQIPIPAFTDTQEVLLTP